MGHCICIAQLSDQYTPIMRSGRGGAGAGGLASFRSLNYTNGAPVDLNIVKF